ncbi:MAG: hypothetical protein ACM3XO_05640 [Bacteroidota bacterium]
MNQPIFREGTLSDIRRQLGPSQEQPAGLRNPSLCEEAIVFFHDVWHGRLRDKSTTEGTDK